MNYCQTCGAELSAEANFCPNCGASISGTNSQNTNQQRANTAKTVGAVAGAAVGVSVLGSLLRRRRRPPMGPPPGGHMGHPGMHGPGGGPRRGGHGPMGGPGGMR